MKGEINGISLSSPSPCRPSRPPSPHASSSESGLSDVGRRPRMKCRSPVIVGHLAFGCGQCLPCRVDRRRIWSHRIMLEASQWGDNAFITLTYDEDHLPADGSLRPRDLSLFLKRYRKSLHPRRVRFFAVGEYGERSLRPHYHIALFNSPACLHGVTRAGRSDGCCAVCRSVRDLWGKGHVLVGRLEPASAAYVAGYVSKKWTAPDEHPGLYPQFTRMSLRPGIGAGMVSEIASTLMEHELDGVLEDVPVSLRHGKQILPLGRYLRRRLREEIGRSPNAPASVLASMEEKLRPLRESAFASALPGHRYEAWRQALIAKGDGQAARIEALQKSIDRRRYL